MNKDIIIIDTDPGSDDALAILSALASKVSADYAFVSTYGNGPIAITEKNLRGVLEHGNYEGKIYHGSSEAINGSEPNYDYYHGRDCIGGIGEALYIETKNRRNVSIAAFDELPAFVEPYETVTYITLGALTNLAKLIQSNSSIISKEINLLIMGGALAHYNAPHDSEYNFSCDPEAVKIVLDSGIPIKLFPFDLSVDYPITASDVEAFAARSKDEILDNLLYALLAAAKKNGRNHADIPDAFPILYRTNYASAFVFKPMTLEADEWGALKETENGTEVEVAVGLNSPDFLYHCFNELFH